MDDVEDLLRRLALNDERSLALVLGGGWEPARDSGPDRKTQALVCVGALLSVGAATTSLRRSVELAQASGATDEEIVGVLLAIGPVVGLARVVAEAPGLALALGFELEDLGAGRDRLHEMG